MSSKYFLKIGKITDHHSLKRIHRRRPGTGIKVSLTPVTSAHPNTTLRLGQPTSRKKIPLIKSVENNLILTPCKNQNPQQPPRTSKQPPNLQYQECFGKGLRKNTTSPQFCKTKLQSYSPQTGDQQYPKTSITAEEKSHVNNHMKAGPQVKL